MTDPNDTTRRIIGTDQNNRRTIEVSFVEDPELHGFEVCDAGGRVLHRFVAEDQAREAAAHLSGSIVWARTFEPGRLARAWAAIEDVRKEAIAYRDLLDEADAAELLRVSELMTLTLTTRHAIGTRWLESTMEYKPWSVECPALAGISCTVWAFTRLEARRTALQSDVVGDDGIVWMTDVLGTSEVIRR